MNAPARNPALLVLLPVPLDELLDAIEERFERALVARCAAPAAGGRVSTEKLGEALGVSRGKVHDLAEAGKLPFIWVGDVRKFSVAECVAALSALPPPPKKPGGPGRRKRK